MNIQTLKILGIDPAITSLGWGIIELTSPTIKYIDSGIIKTTAQDSIWHRLFTISSAIETIVDQYHPSLIAMEETFINKNPKSSIKLAYVRGAIMAIIGRTKLPYFEFSPNKIKKTITGVGHAEKEQVKHMVTTIISGMSNNISFDESDALAIAYTCLVHHQNHNTRIPTVTK